MSGTSNRIVITDDDVLCGQNVKALEMKQHKGTLVWKLDCLDSVHEYRPENKDKKSRAIEGIKTKVSRRGGRFLIKKSESSDWIEQTKKQTNDKISAYLLSITKLTPEELYQERIKIEEKLQLVRKRELELDDDNGYHNNNNDVPAATTKNDTMTMLPPNTKQLRRTDDTIIASVDEYYHDHPNSSSSRYNYFHDRSADDVPQITEHVNVQNTILPQDPLLLEKKRPPKNNFTELSVLESIQLPTYHTSQTNVGIDNRSNKSDDDDSFDVDSFLNDDILRTINDNGEKIEFATATATTARSSTASCFNTLQPAAPVKQTPPPLTTRGYDEDEQDLLTALFEIDWNEYDPYTIPETENQNHFNTSTL